MNHLVILPFITFMAAGLFLWVRRRSALTPYVSATVMGAQLVFALLLLKTTMQTESAHLVYQVGNWAAPYGVTLVVDVFSALMLVVCIFVAWAATIYSIGFPAMKGEVAGKVHAFLHFLMGGVSASFVAGDLFNLYVSFEVMLISSFALVTFATGDTRWRGGIKYILMNLISSMFFLIGAGLVYGTYGSLNLAHLSQMVLASENHSVLIVPSTFLLIAFAIKSAAFPVFSWLPACYPNLYAPIAALFAGLLTKVGIYAILRVSSLIIAPAFGLFQFSIATIAGLTMLVGVLAAASRLRMKEILSFHIISQVGYMIMGISIFTTGAFAATLFYLCHHIIAKSNLFFIQGIAEHKFGTDDLAKQGGLLRSNPLWAVTFLFSALALAGLPPFSGFFAKYLVIKAGLDAGFYWVSAAALVTGLLTLFSMSKIWNESFLKDRPSDAKNRPVWRPALVAIVGLSSVTLLLGIGFSMVYGVFELAGEQVANPVGYIEAVLGRR